MKIFKKIVGWILIINVIPVWFFGITILEAVATSFGSLLALFLSLLAATILAVALLFMGGFGIQLLMSDE